MMKLLCAHIIILLLTIFITAGCTGNSETITSEVTDTDSTKSSLQDTAGSGPDEHGHLRAEQGNIIDENGNKYQLRGLSTHGVGWYPDYVNAGAMKSVREKGGNVMRAAMYTEADSGYLSAGSGALDARGAAFLMTSGSRAAGMGAPKDIS